MKYRSETHCMHFPSLSLLFCVWAIYSLILPALFPSLYPSISTLLFSHATPFHLTQLSPPQNLFRLQQTGRTELSSLTQQASLLARQSSRPQPRYRPSWEIREHQRGYTLMSGPGLECQCLLQNILLLLYKVLAIPHCCMQWVLLVNTNTHSQTSAAEKSLVMYYKLHRKSPPKISTCLEIRGKTMLLSHISSRWF